MNLEVPSGKEVVTDLGQKSLRLKDEDFLKFFFFFL